MFVRPPRTVPQGIRFFRYDPKLPGLTTGKFILHRGIAVVHPESKTIYYFDERREKFHDNFFNEVFADLRRKNIRPEDCFLAGFRKDRENQKHTMVVVHDGGERLGTVDLKTLFNLGLYSVASMVQLARQKPAGFVDNHRPFFEWFSQQLGRELQFIGAEEGMFKLHGLKRVAERQEREEER